MNTILEFSDPYYIKLALLKSKGPLKSDLLIFLESSGCQVFHFYNFDNLHYNFRDFCIWIFLYVEK